MYLEEIHLSLHTDPKKTKEREDVKKGRREKERRGEGTRKEEKEAVKMQLCGGSSKCRRMVG